MGRAQDTFRNSKSYGCPVNLSNATTCNVRESIRPKARGPFSNHKALTRRTVIQFDVTNTIINWEQQLMLTMLTTLTSARTLLQLQKSTSNLVMYNLNQAPKITSAAPSVFTKVWRGPPSINTLNSEFKIKSGAPINKDRLSGPQSGAQPAVKPNHITTDLQIKVKCGPTTCKITSYRDPKVARYGIFTKYTKK
jgi:hypothetical protein